MKKIIIILIISIMNISCGMILNTQDKKANVYYSLKEKSNS